jgi:hypothetical protein
MAHPKVPDEERKSNKEGSSEYIASAVVDS